VPPAETLVTASRTISKFGRNRPDRIKLERLALFLGVTILISGCDSLVNQAAFYPDDRGATAVPTLESPVEERHFFATDGVRLHAYYLPNAASDRLMVFFHGNGGNSTQRLGDAASLRSLGVAVLLPSYRGYPGSEGSPSERGVYLDGEATLRFAVEELGFAPANTFVLGRSLGSAVAVHVAQRKGLAGLILVTPISSGDDFAAYHNIGWMRRFLGNPFDSATKLQSVTEPILIIHGTADTTLPVEMGHALLKRASGDAEMVEVLGAGHNDLLWRAGPCYWLWIGRFLRGESIDSGASAPPPKKYRKCLDDARTVSPAPAGL
jgi:fermentation-respiration switch protein FrsA (DUF1100 family)